ncbi:hypothetical protein VP1G_04344 [Cytospora mali]|uniref:Uncharacterized protein n=1 Tax=Cytospora mali TaxID=578113 RepID=A0A194UZC2_CYTMA|nr:hypothetical protein VP1G_04344 [Valsa mali var. pyri (nom. inval.)]
MTFDMHFDTASKATFLSLRAPVAMTGNALQEETPLYLHIAPDRIASLAYNGPKDTPANMRQELGNTMICLQFGMSKLADLIGPSGSSWKPRKRKDGAVLDALKRLAHATSFSVYLEYQDALSDTLLQTRTAGVVDKSLILLEREYDITSLYAGSGGQLLVTAPPSYDTLEAPPPAGGASSSRSSKKRPRHDSSEPEAGGSQAVEDICRKLVAGALAQLSHESTQVGKELQLLRAEVSALQQTKTDNLAELQRMRTDFTAKLQQTKTEMKTEMKTELTKHVEEQVIAIAEDPQTLLHATIEKRNAQRAAPSQAVIEMRPEHRCDTKEMLDNCIFRLSEVESRLGDLDNTIYDTVYDKVTEMVEEEMAEVKESILDTITSETLNVRVSIAGHPYY